MCRLRCVSTVRKKRFKNPSTSIKVTVLRVEDGSRFHRTGTAVEMSSCRSSKKHAVVAGVECLNAETVMAVDDWWRWQGSPVYLCRWLYEQWHRALQNNTRWRIGSQWSSRRSSVAPLRHDAWVTALATAFWMRCRSRDSGSVPVNHNLRCFGYDFSSSI